MRNEERRNYERGRRRGEKEKETGDGECKEKQIGEPKDDLRELIKGIEDDLARMAIEDGLDGNEADED